MGIINGLLGNASEINAKEIEEEFLSMLVDNEKIEKAFRLIRDLFVFTNKRLIIVDKQGLTGKKIDYLSIPYKSVATFSVETAGHLDMDSELKIWIRGFPGPVIKEFKRSSNIEAVHKALAHFVLNNN